MLDHEEYCKKFLENIHGAVEATSFERMCLWERNRDRAKREWVENLSGIGKNVGEFSGSPVFISLLTAMIDGKKILFYEATSVVVNWDIIEKWLQDNLPKSAFRKDGRLNKTDAMNFHNIF